MRVLLDDRECQKPGQTLAEAIAEAAGVAESQGRVIVEVQVDGAVCTGAQLESLHEPGADAREVRLVSAERRGTLRAVFRDAGEALLEADEHQREAAELIQADQGTQAMEKLGEALSIWGSVQQALAVGAEMIRIDLNEQRVGDTPVTEIIGQLNEQLRTIRDALEAGDPIGLSDTLLYDLPETVTQWRAVFAAMSDLVDETPDEP